MCKTFSISHFQSKSLSLEVWNIPHPARTGSQTHLLLTSSQMISSNLIRSPTSPPTWTAPISSLPSSWLLGLQHPPLPRCLSECCLSRQDQLDSLCPSKPSPTKPAWAAHSPWGPSMLLSDALSTLTTMAPPSTPCRTQGHARP